MTELEALTDSEQAKYVQDPRVALIGPYEEFGITCARIFTTHFSEEPGYAEYRSVSIGTFTERTDDEENEIQNAGIIFNRDEKPGKSTSSKNLSCSVYFLLKIQIIVQTIVCYMQEEM